VKLLNTALGRILVSVAVVLVVLMCLSALLPSIGDFTAKVFPVEKNYVSSSTVAFDSLLNYKSKDNYRENVFELVIDDPDDENDNFNPDEDIFDNFIVSDSDDQALVDEFKTDYQKTYTERTKVFVYKINKQGYSVLVDKIDPSVVSEWAVIYVIDDGTQRATLRVDYVFKN